LGRYRITGTLGKGGFGVVYKGHDDDLRREVWRQGLNEARGTGLEKE